MRTQSVPISTLSEPVDHARILRQMERFAWLMDQSFAIPGTRIRLGLDALIGLLPVAGDVVTGVAQSALVLAAHHHFHLPKALAARMAANVLIDVLVGSVPLLGDLFDVSFKANARNLVLLKRHLASRDPSVKPTF